MRVLMLAPEPFLEPRGTPISVYQRLMGLSRLGHAVDLVTYPIGENVSIQGVRIYRGPRLPFIKKVKTGASWTKLLLDLFLFLRAFSLLASRRYDVIHSHEETAFFAGALARLFRISHLYDMHSSLPEQLRHSSFGRYRLAVSLFEWLERQTLDTCDALITIAPDLEERALQRFTGERHVTIQNLAVQLETPSASNSRVAELRDLLQLGNAPIVLYTGNFEPYQGIDLLVEAAAWVAREKPEARFVLVGGQPQQIKSWKTEVLTRGLADCFRFVGIQPVGEMRNWLALATILVSPRIEGMSVPLKIYSYLAAGRPIVATNILAHSMVLSSEVALLTVPEPQEFGAGIVKLLESPALREELAGGASCLASERHSASAYLASLDRIYQSLRPVQKLATESPGR